MSIVAIMPTDTDYKAQLAKWKKTNGANVNDLTNAMRAAAEEGQYEPEMAHHFIPDFYIRQMGAKAGSLIVTKVHLTVHPLFISKGRCVVYDEESDKTFLVQAPFMTITMPGTRRVILVIEDALWTTMHRTDKTTVEEAEKEMLLDETAYLSDTQTNDHELDLPN
jgi:hypothetical protein